MPTPGGAWRSASQPTLDYGTGGEQVARAGLLQIATNLSQACALINTLWLSRDQDWAEAMEFPFKPTSINQPAKSALYLGMQPSLVAGQGARFDLWPAITVRCDVRRPSFDQPDQYDTMDVEFIVEVLASAGPFVTDPADDRGSSDEVDRQYQRLSDAVIACINVDRSLGGNILPISDPPIMTPSMPFVKRLDRGAGPWTIYQGAELLWHVTTMTRAQQGL